MESKMLSVFPEISEIESVELREKVVSVFEDGLKRGSWSYDTFYSMPYTVSYPATVKFREHVRGVTAIALAMYEQYQKIYPNAKELNRDYIIAGALLHDVGKLLEITIDESGQAVKSENGKLLRHAFTGVSLAMCHDIPDEVSHIIAVHSHEGNASKRTVMAELIQRSDQLNEFFSKLE